MEAPDNVRARYSSRLPEAPFVFTHAWNRNFQLWPRSDSWCFLRSTHHFSSPRMDLNYTVKIRYALLAISLLQLEAG